MKTTAQEKPTLIPADRERCRAERLDGSFMTLGPRQMMRCTAKPEWIATERAVDPVYGAPGEMSLCGDCRRVLEEHYPDIAARIFFTPVADPLADMGRQFGLQLKRSLAAREEALKSIGRLADGRWQAQIGGKKRGRAGRFASRIEAERAVNAHYNEAMAAWVRTHARKQP